MPLAARRPVATASQLVAVLAHLHDAAAVRLGVRHLVAGDGVIEVPLAVGLQVVVERVVVGVADGVVVEVFVEVGFTVAVEVVQSG